MAEIRTRISSAEVFVSCILEFGLEGWFRNPPEKEWIRGKNSCKTSFQVGMDLKKYINKAETKERKKTTMHLLCILEDVG